MQWVYVFVPELPVLYNSDFFIEIISVFSKVTAE